MPRAMVWLLPGVFLLSLVSPAAQTPPKDAAKITLGQSAVPLYGPWKFTVGDSPVDPVTHHPIWASPGFDDSKWETVDLTPESGALNPISGQTGNVPGWTHRGHADYWGYAWYRIHIRLESAPGVDLALAGPAQVDDAYQLFENGTYVGAFGDFSSRWPSINYTQPVMFSLPRAASSFPNGSTRVLAFRVWMQPQTLVQSAQVGGFESAPILGENTAIAAVHQVQFDELVRAYLWQPIEAAVFGLLGLVTLSLFLFDRSDRVYLWIGALLLMIALDGFSGTFAVWSTSVSALYDTFSHDLVLFSLQYAGWVMVWRAWFRQRRPLWIPWALIPLSALLVVSRALNENLFFTVSNPVATAAGVVSLMVRLVLSVILLYVVIKGIREQGLEGWLVLPAVLLTVAAEFAREWHSIGLKTNWFPFHVQITLPVASQLLLVLVLAILLLRRLILSIRRQRLMALDVKQAQEVQQVILPEAQTAHPGLAIESVYRPAREVGGDFFQIIPHPTDGSLLIVAGDVNGKGLKAGMLVALMVGAIRTAAESDPGPATVLNTLNRRLLGRSEAHATCLALRIGSDGYVTLANAGHMPPYWNGKELEIAGSLPLGLVENLDCSKLEFQMAANDRLLLLSDGVAEATDESGRLFGFDRVEEMIRAQPTAVSLANAAQAFGQNDDISIISVTRTTVAQTALA